MLQISYSSASTQDTCPRKYYLQKIARVPRDMDNVEDTEALAVGKAVHYICEKSEYNHMKFKMELLAEALDKFKLAESEHAHKVYACATAIFILRNNSGLKFVAAEIPIGSEEDGTSGLIDLILVDVNGYWWIDDLKTSGMFSADIAARLAEDLQLNLYARYKNEMAKKFGLDPAKFAGVRYTVVVKPRSEPKAGEHIKDYAKRAKVQAHEFEIPHYLLDPTEVTEWIDRAREKATTCAADESAWPKKRSSCFQWNKPCEYWSYCHHGRTFTEALGAIVSYNLQTMRDVTLTELPQEGSVDFLME